MSTFGTGTFGSGTFGDPTPPAEGGSAGQTVRLGAGKGIGLVGGLKLGK